MKVRKSAQFGVKKWRDEIKMNFYNGGKRKVRRDDS